MRSRTSPQRKTLIALIFAIVVMSALIMLNEIGYRRSKSAVESILLVHDKRGTVHQLLQQTLDAEASQRGYLLTGDVRYMVRYSNALKTIGGTLDFLRDAYVSKAVEEVAHFEKLSKAVARTIDEHQATLTLREAGESNESWTNNARFNAGSDAMQEARVAAHALIDSSTAEMASMQREIDRGLLVSRLGISLVALLALIALALYLRQTQKLSRAIDDRSRAIAAERDRLEALVRERTLRLTQLADHLQVVQETEREHLARELHDELGALLTAAKLDIARLRSKMTDANHPFAERMTHLNGTLNAVIALKRRIVEDLRPSSLTHLGLVPALEILTREFASSAAVSVAIEAEPVQPTPEIALALYRITQESLTNIARYASAKNVLVKLRAHDGFVELTVEDDGSGFDVSARLNASHGFAGMQHRASALGGRLDVTSVPNAGTRITVVIPMVPPEAFVRREPIA